MPSVAGSEVAGSRHIPRRLDEEARRYPLLIRRAERPFASHALYTQFLDDTDKEERERGMRLGWDFLHSADLVAIYMDRGLTDGMRRGVGRAESVGVPTEVRYLSDKRGA